MGDKKVSLKSGKITRDTVGGRTIYEPLTITGSTGEISEKSFVILNSSAGNVAATLPAPKPGWFLVIFCSNSDNTTTVTLDAGTWNGSNAVATFPVNSCLVVFGVSSTRFIIVENVGTVSFSG